MAEEAKSQVHQKSNEIEQPSSEMENFLISPFQFFGKSPNITLPGGYYTDLRVESQYYLDSMLQKDETSNTSVALKEDAHFIPIGLGTEVFISGDKYEVGKKSVFILCGSIPDINRSNPNGCFGVILNGLDLRFYTVPLLDLQVEMFPRNCQQVLSENLDALQTWTQHVSTNNLPFEELQHPPKSLKDVKKLIASRPSYGRESALAARKKILDLSPSKQKRGYDSENEHVTDRTMSKAANKEARDLKKALLVVEQFQSRMSSMEKTVAVMKKELTAAAAEIKVLNKALAEKDESRKKSRYTKSATAKVKIETPPAPTVQQSSNPLPIFPMQLQPNPIAMQMLQQATTGYGQAQTQPVPIAPFPMSNLGQSPDVTQVHPFSIFPINSSIPGKSSTSVLHSKQKVWMKAPDGEWKYVDA